MANIIDALVVTLGLDSREFDRGRRDVDEGLDQVRDNSSRTAKEMEARGKQAAAFLGSIKSELIGLLAVVGAGKGLSGFMSESISGTAALGRFAANLGMSARELDGWGTAAEAFGGSAEGVRNSMQHLAGSISELAITGNSAIVPFMRSLNIAMTDSQGKVRDYRDIMLDLADRFKEMSAQEAISYGKMMGLDEGTVTLLRQGRAEVQNLVGQMTGASGITQASVEASQRMQKTWAVVNQQLRGVGQTIFTEMAPALERVAQELVRFSAWITANHDVVVNFFIAAASGAAALAIATISIWGPVVALAAAIAGLSAGVAWLWQEWQTWTNSGETSLAGLFQFVTEVFNGIKTAWAACVGPMTEMFNHWLAVVQSIFGMVVALATGSSADIRKAWNDLTGDLGAFFGDWVKVVEGLAPKIGDAIIKSVRSAWDYIKNRFKAFGDVFGDLFGEDETDPATGQPAVENSSTPAAAAPTSSGARTDAPSMMLPTDGKQLPRGIRNNNPGNLNFANQAGATKEGGANGRFAKFGTMDEGIRALVRQLKLYHQRGTDTIREIVNKYAPASDGNNTQAYMAALSKAMGIGVDEQIDINDSNQLIALVKGITNHENGKGYVSDAQIVAGVTGGVQVGAGARASASGGGAPVNTTTNETTIGKIEVHTKATDAEAIAGEIGPAIKQNGLVNQAATADT